MKMIRNVGLLCFTASLLFSTGCRSTYYATMEKFGVHKRDMLKENVEEARDEQKKATEQFKDALTRLRELYNIDGGDLEKTYDRLKADFDRSETRATAVRERIDKVETVAGDLFKEWEKEISEMESSKLASQSREKLRATREKYESLHTAMTRAEASMEPVLKQFRDQVLYLKHNLNAAAIGALKGETVDIEKEIQQLIKDMNASIQQADSFIQGLGE
ncbi:MAG TPA: DUF2959 domain-containing protein [Verrucomicrobiae bacterium]